MAEEAENAPAAGSSKKKLLIIVGVVVALLAINVGAIIFIVKSMTPEQPAAEAGQEAATGGEHGGPMAAEPIYVPLDPPFVVNFEDQTLVRFLQVTVEVMTHDPAVAEALKTHDAEIRNNLVLLFSSQTQEAVSTRAGKEKIRAQALAEVQSILQKHIGRPGVEEIYFTSFVMQ